MHPEKLGFEDCDLSSIFKVIDKETQTNVSNTIRSSDSTSKSYKLPLPRELEKTEEGTIKVFSFCQIIQDPECPTSITIVRESVTEEVHSHSNTPDDEAFSNRYRYCKEVIKPYLRDYPPDCPDSGELLIRDAIITANEEFPEYPPCYEIPNPEAKKSEEPQDLTKKPEKSAPEGKKPEETKKPEEQVKQGAKLIPPKETSKSPKPSEKPAEDKKERRHLILCPNEKVPKICIEITDPQICQEICKKQKLLQQEQKEKEGKKSVSQTEELVCDKPPTKDCKDSEGKRTEEDCRKRSDDICTPEGNRKGSDDKCIKEDTCGEFGDKRKEEVSCSEKPKEQPCIKKSEKKSRLEVPECKEKPPTESQKSSHPEQPCKHTLPPVPPKQPKEGVCPKQKEEEYCPKQKAEEYRPEDYKPVVCPPEDYYDDQGCWCEEIKDKSCPPEPAKEIAVLPKQDKKPIKSDKSGGPSDKPCPSKKDFSKQEKKPIKSDKTGWPSKTESKPCPFKDIPVCDKTSFKSDKTGSPTETESKPCPHKKDLSKQDKTLIKSDKTGSPPDTQSKPCPNKKDSPSQDKILTKSDKTGPPSKTECKPCPFKKDSAKQDKPPTKSDNTGSPSETESKPCPHKKDLPKQDKTLIKSDKTGSPPDTQNKPCPNKKDSPSQDKIPTKSDKIGPPSKTECKPCPFKKDYGNQDKPPIKSDKTGCPSDTESKPCPHRKDSPNQEKTPIKSDKTGPPSKTECKPCPFKKDSANQDKPPIKSDKTGCPSDIESKPCPNKKELPPIPQRMDCLSKLLDSLSVKSKDNEACIRKPIPNKTDGSSEKSPNKKCVPRPKTPPTVTSIPVKGCVKESRSDRKLCKPKTSKCDVRKSQGKDNVPKGKSRLDDGRCNCEKDGVKNQKGPAQSQAGQSQSAQDQKTPVSPILPNTTKGETCQSIDGKNVKTALQAHNETMATLKCAMEDFMCKVFRSTQDAVTLITTESAKQLEKLRKSNSRTECECPCPPPKKVSDTHNNRDNLRRFSVVNIDNSPKELPDCVPPSSNESNGPSQYIDMLVKKVDSALSMVSDILVFEMPKPIRPSSFNDSSSKYDIPISSRPLPKDIENVVVPPASSSMFSTIKDTLWSLFCDDGKSEKSSSSKSTISKRTLSKGSLSKSSSTNTATSESDEDLLHKMID